jgi:hypothetical protein
LRAPFFYIRKEGKIVIFSRRLAIAAALAGLICVGFAIQSEADSPLSSTSPGSSDDPLVTKSYVDDQIRKLTGVTISNPALPSSLTKDEVQKLINEEIAKAKQEWLLTMQQSLDLSSTNSSAANETPDKDAKVTTLKLETGDTLYGGAGAEFVVRTGKAIAFTTDANGISDVTSGSDIPGNSAIELNHLLIFPREGRGIKPDPKQSSEIYVVIKGNYLLHKADGTDVTP